MLAGFGSSESPWSESLPVSGGSSHAWPYVAACRAGESKTWLIGVELLDGLDGRSAGFGAGLWVDQHLLEEGLVHELLDVGGRVAIAAGAVLEEVEGSLEVCLQSEAVRLTVG